MNTPVMAEAPVRSRDVGEIPFRRRFAWLIRREIMENRSIYLAFLAVAPLIVVGFAIRLATMPGKLRAAAALDALHQHAVIEQPYTFAAMLLMFVSVLVSLFYSVDALYGERRDRSILFWKSLPVSDLETVLAKAAIPILVIPVITFVATFFTQVLMLLMTSLRLAGTGLSVWSQLSFGQMTWVLFYHLVLGHGFWFAPYWGWFLLASAWARRAPFLWATLPVLAVSLLEKIAFNTAYFGQWIAYRFSGGPVSGPGNAEPMTIAGVTPVSWSQSLTSPGFWFGLALTALFLMAAVRLRRLRGPS